MTMKRMGPFYVESVMAQQYRLPSSQLVWNIGLSVLPARDYQK
jgi:hypothetical protein